MVEEDGDATMGWKAEEAPLVGRRTKGDVVIAAPPPLRGPTKPTKEGLVGTILLRDATLKYCYFLQKGEPDQSVLM